MDAILFCGLPAAGKSTFYQQRFFHTHVRINLDMLRTRHRERLLLRACLDAGQPFVVDNTNPTAQERARYIGVAKEAGFRVTGYVFEPDVAGSLRRNSQRGPGQRVPPVAIYSAHKRFVAPSLTEGFDRLFMVRVASAGGFAIMDWPTDEAPAV